MKFTNLSSVLSEHLSLHSSRIKCLTFFVLSILKVRTVNLSRVAQMMFYEKPESAYTRLKRFIKEVTFDASALAKLIVNIAGFNSKQPLTLVFDRTNWKFGKSYINILFLAVNCKYIALPIFFTFLKGKKSGNSNQQDRIDLINKFIKTFGVKRIGLILGDREFIGAKWLNYLRQKKIAFCVRLKEGWQKVSLIDGRIVEVKKCFPGLQKGEMRSLGLRQLGEGKSAVMCCITGLRNEKGDWVIVAHSEGLENPCEIYRRRWQIECMFRSMKTGGFNLEDTHVTDSSRLECLLSVLAIAYAIGYKAGEYEVTENPPKVKNHGYWPKTILRYGLEKLEQLIIRINTKFIEFKEFMKKILPDLKPRQKFFVP